MAQLVPYVVEEEGVGLDSGPFVDDYERLRDFLFRYEASSHHSAKEASAEGNG